MNVSYKWLKEYVDFDMTAEEVGKALTSMGLEVEAVEEVQSIKGGLQGLVVGQVLTCEPHPNSDHMHVTTVDEGNGVVEQIVCGAPNVAAGQKVIVAQLGCKLYDGDKEFVIKKSKLRGIESNGMICAEDEIGVGTSHDGIIVLPEDAVVGTPAAEYYGLESDYVIEVDITPNHSDACSHWGVARDFYAYLKQNGYETSLHRPSVDDFKVQNNDLKFDVEVEAGEACPRYCAVSVKNCEVKESPKWLKDRLTAIGQRPINNIVDITNYIMMAYGQPLHCFDADMVKGNKVVVKTNSLIRIWPSAMQKSRCVSPVCLVERVVVRMKPRRTCCSRVLTSTPRGFARVPVVMACRQMQVSVLREASTLLVRSTPSSVLRCWHRNWQVAKSAWRLSM